MAAFVVALVGAESTGKSTLASALAAALLDAGHDAVCVDEALREFCTCAGRTPRIDEQRAIADAQTQRIETAAAAHAIVIADTTALMIAVYSDWVFGDRSLYGIAEAAHARADLTLLTALDLPWQADSLQRDGAHVREPIDALVRAALDRSAAAYSVVHGSGCARLQAALAATLQALHRRSPEADSAPWRHVCARCS